jgi:hypothetical protein
MNDVVPVGYPSPQQLPVDIKPTVEQNEQGRLPACLSKKLLLTYPRRAP